MSSGRIPEPEPPDAELGEAAESTGGKGLAIVGADALREPIGAEEPLEHLLGGLEQRTLEPVTGQQIAGVGVLDRERIAVAAIAEAELAFEVDRPDHIGASDRGLRPAWVSADLRSPAAGHAAVPDQDAMDGRGGGHLRRGMSLEEELVELAGAPAPMLTELEDLADHCGCRGMRALLGPMRAVGETVGAELGIAVEPFVAGLAADAVTPAELGEGGGGVLGIEHEALALVHG